MLLRDESSIKNGGSTLCLRLNRRAGGCSCRFCDFVKLSANVFSFLSETEISLTKCDMDKISSVYYTLCVGRHIKVRKETLL